MRSGIFVGWEYGILFDVGKRANIEPFLSRVRLPSSAESLIAFRVLI